MSDLQRFKEAQRRDFDTALAEIKNGRKQSHWMWYIFPQIHGLGFSSMSAYYAIKDLDQGSQGSRRFSERPLPGRKPEEDQRGSAGTGYG